MSDAIRQAPDRRRYRDGVRAALPLGLADLAFGTWFGVRAPVLLVLVAATATTALARLLL
jgi:hypothetical protein